MAQHRHKRETPATTPRPSRIPRSVLVSAPLAVVATLSAVTMGVLAAEPATNDNLLASSGTSQPAAGSSADTVDDTALRRRSETTTVSRSQIRTAAKAEAAARKDRRGTRGRGRQAGPPAGQEGRRRRVDHRGPQPLGRPVARSPRSSASSTPLKQVSVTGREQAGRTQVVIDGQSRWVTSDYLSAEKPKPEPKEPAGPSLGGACTNGSSIDAGRASLYDDPRRGLRQLARDHQLRHVAQRRRARPGPRHRHHGQRRDRLGHRRVPARQLRRARHRVHHLLPAASGPWSAPARAGAGCPTVGRRPPTTTTTCTSRSTDARASSASAALARLTGR